jgi:predicted amidohydrolase
MTDQDKLHTASPAHVRIAAAQYPLDRLETLGDYQAKISRWVHEAAMAGAQLLVFPEYGAMELAGTGRASTPTLEASLAAVADAMPTMERWLTDLARAHGVYILGATGPVRGADNSYTNPARLYAPSGASAAQHKCMMTPFERNWGITAGKQLNVFDTSLGKIGVAICYDSEFPLLVRAMAAAGADLILVPACTEFISGANRIRTAALARALENGCAVITSPTVGDAPWSPAVDYNVGRAGIYLPSEHGLSETGVLAEGELNRPMWVYAEVDLAHLRRIRTSGEMRNALDWADQPGAGAPAPVTVVKL